MKLAVFGYSVLFMHETKSYKLCPVADSIPGFMYHQVTLSPVTAISYNHLCIDLSLPQKLAYSSCDVTD